MSGNTRAFEEAELFAREENITYTGGAFMVPITIRNTGNIAYTVNSLLMSAYTIDLADTNSVQMIGALSQEGGIAFSPFTLNPGAQSGVFNYVNTEQNLDDLRGLACFAEAVVCGVSGYHITMTTDEGATVDFTSSATTVAARTAKIIVDFGPGTMRPARQHHVATLTKYNDDYTGPDDMYFPVTMREIAASLYLDYELGVYQGNQGLVSVDGLANDSVNNAFWFMVHTTKGGERVRILGIRDTSYAFDDVAVAAGDIVELIYSKDQDGDGIPVRIERLMGISDTDTDSDGDGLDDDEEISAGTNPALADTDHDGVNDKDDPDPLRRPMASSTSILRLALVSAADTLEQWTTDTLTDTLIAPAFDVHAVEVTIETEQPLYLAVANDQYPLRRDAADPRRYSGAVPLLLGDNEVIIVVTSEDETTVDTTVLTVPSSLDNFDEVVIASVSDGMHTTFNTLKANFNWAQVKDNRPEGLILLACESDTFDAFTLEPKTTNYTDGEQLGGGITVVAVDGRAAASSSITHTAITFNTRHYYALCTWQEVDGVFHYSEPVTADGKTSGKARVTVTLVSIDLVSLGGDPGDCIEVYNTVNVTPPGSTTPLSLFNLGSGNAKDVCGVPGYSPNASQAFTMNPGESFTIAWYLSEVDDSSPDDHLGHGETPRSYDDVLAPYGSDYVKPAAATFTQYSSGDGGAVNLQFTFGYELIE
ncbi:MAG: hypothetical protein GF331_18000 [Chitinivibrionales bacterium]|nr:hypothetical protein [Chitinivibrionales bacterium]